MSRRNFLRKLGVGVAAIPLAKFATANHPTRNKKPLIRLGVLVPDATRYPILADNFIGGLQLHLKSNQDYERHEIEVVTEKYKADNSDLIKKVNKLSDVDQVDIMTGIISPTKMDRLVPILEAREVLFIENTIGEKVQRSPSSACIVRNSFHLWNASFITGQWAARILGKRGVMTTSFYDNGFNSHIAFEAGFINAGGQLLHRIVTDMPNQDGHLTLGTVLKEDQPDFVFAQYSGNEAISFVHQYRNYNTRVPLIGSGLLCTDSNLNGQIKHANGIQSHATWTRTLKTKENNAFVNAFEQQYQRYTDVYALLGFETGILLRTALSNTGQYPTTQDLMHQLSDLTIKSPRGSLHVHNQETSCGVYLKQVQPKDNYFLEYTSEQVGLQDINQQAVSEMLEGIQSGWSNAYMC